MTHCHVCERCSGTGTIWTGSARIICPRCGGTGSGLTR